MRNRETTVAFFTKSIRWRLLVWLGFLLVAILGGFGVTAYEFYRVNRLGEIDDGLMRRAALLSADVRGPKLPGSGAMADGPGGPGGPPPEFERRGGPPARSGRSKQQPPEPRGEMTGGPGEMGARSVRLSAATAALFDETDPAGHYYRVWFRTGVGRTASANAPTDNAPMPALAQNDTGAHTRTRGQFRETYQSTERGDAVLAGISIAAFQAETRRFAWLLVAAGAAVLAVGLGGGWVIATRAIRPLEAIGATANRISAGNLAERINVTDTDSELGQLAGVLNTTFARLEAAFAKQRNFTADASHELRTPLAVIISEAQTTLARERGADDYKATVEVCLETAQQMRQLTERLLELARLDAGQESPGRTTFDFAEVARACADLVRPLAKRRGIRVECGGGAAVLKGDATGLAQVVTNLLSNAIHYNADGGEVRLEVRAEGVGAVLTVSDTGVGIAAEDLPHIFERFYRADKSRSRAEGRSGLGLAITKAVVEAHGGTIKAESVAGEGTTFTVRLPG